MKVKVTILFLGMGLLLAGCGGTGNKPDMKENFYYKSATPFGSKVAYKMLQQQYANYYIDLVKEPFSTASTWWGDNNALYFCLSNHFYTDKKDAGTLLNFVKMGNTAFIASNNIDSNLTSQLYLESTQPNFYDNGPSYYSKTKTKLLFGNAVPPQEYSYYYHPFKNIFFNIKNSYYKKLGYTHNISDPNLLIIYWGKGKIILHTEPKALSNYFLLTDNNYHYFSTLLSLFPAQPDHIYWDDYYRNIDYREETGEFSTLATIFKYPALKWALLLAFALLVLYILVNGKRRQRIIPVIPQVKNDSIAFAQAVAGLYLKENDNKAISKKMISFFNEFIRSKYFLNSLQVTDSYLQALSSKSNLPLEKIKDLYQQIQGINGLWEVSDEQLLKLNEQFQYFYKNKS